MRLLQLLGIWYEKGSILIFVDKQEKCDQLFHDLLKSGYPCLSLHGGHDQADRDHTLYEYRTGIKTVMVATSAASRGLDIPEIVVVINYNCPNHLEEYVHRVGRTGRAGRKGTAYTFISPQEEQYSPIMIRALEKAEQTPPQELVDMAQSFKEKVTRGEAHYSHSGFGGEGFTFDASEMNEAQKVASQQKRQYEIEQGLVPDKDDDYIDDDEEPGEGGAAVSAGITSSSSSSSAAVAASGIIAPDSPAFAALPPLERAQMMAKYLASRNAIPTIGITSTSTASTSSSGGAIDPNQALARARQIAQQMGTRGFLPDPSSLAAGTDSGITVEQKFHGELEINDYPPQARRKVTQRTCMDDITERAGVTVISRGTYVAPGKKLEPGERKLHLVIEGTSEMSIKFAKMEILKALEDETLKLGASSTTQFGRYSVT